MAADIDISSITPWTGTLDSASPFGHAIAVPMAAGSDRVVCLALTSGLGGTEPVFTVTADGNAMTLLDKTATGGPNSQERLYYLAMGTGGAATVSVFVGVGSWYGQKVAITGFVLTTVDQATPWAAPAKNGSSFQNSPISTAINATANDLTIIVAGANAATGIGFGAGQTSLGALTGLDTVVPAHSYKLGASASVSTSWTSGQTQASQLAAVARGASVSVLAGNVTLDAAVAAGTMGSSASDLSGGVTLDAAVAAGTLGQAPGTINLVSLRNENNGPHGAITIPFVSISRVTDGVQVLVLAGVVLDAGGSQAITNGALVPGQWYVVTCHHTDRSKAGIFFRQAV